MNVSEMQRDLVTKKAAIESTMAAQITAAAAESNRARTAEEVATVATMIDDAQKLQARILRAQGDEAQAAEIERLTGGMFATNPAQGTRVPRSLGQQFASHPEFVNFIKQGLHRRSGSWVSPTIEAATLTTDIASGGALVQPQLLPGIQPLLYKRLTIRDLLAPGTTDSNAILYLKELLFTNAADTVLEGAPKPESTMTFAQATSPVQKLAHWLPVTEEMLEDYAGIQSYIDARLRLGLDLTVEDQLLNGSGVAPDLLGLRINPGLSADVPRGTDTNMDAIFKQITAIASTALIQPDGIVINPANWMAIQLAKNAAGNYLGTGPWAAAQPPTLWGLPVVVTPAIPAGVGLVGAFKSAAQVFAKGGVRVEISNSHSDFFIKNLVAIRAEERLALAVYRPLGFGEVTGLN